MTETTEQIIKKFIPRAEKQEHEKFLASKEAVNQWHSSLLIFAGLVMSVLGNQSNKYAYVLIVFWLIEALFILKIFLVNHNIHNLMLNRYFEGAVSEEQEQHDIKNAEEETKCFNKLALYGVFIFTFLTIIYFLLRAFGLVFSPTLGTGTATIV